MIIEIAKLHILANYVVYFIVGADTMPNRRKIRARKKRVKRQKMLNLMERIKKKENEMRSESPLLSCPGTSQEPSSSVVGKSSVDMTASTLKDDVEPTVTCSEKRKSEFLPIKRENKRSRTSSNNRGKKDNLNWPKKNSSTSCLSSWLVAAEDIFVPSPVGGLKDNCKTKRSRDEDVNVADDLGLVSQPVKKTKSSETPVERMSISPKSTPEKMEISPVSTSNKRTRHCSVQDNCELRISESESSPLRRPVKRTKSITDTPSEFLEFEAECLPVSSKHITTPVKCTVTPPTPSSSRAERPCSVPRMRSPEVSDLYGLALKGSSRSRSSLTVC